MQQTVTFERVRSTMDLLELVNMFTSQMTPAEADVCEYVAECMGIQPEYRGLSLLLLVQKTMARHETLLITFQNLGDTWVDNLVCQCLTHSGISIPLQRELAIYYLETFKSVPDCEMISHLYEFKIFHNRAPSRDEFVSFLVNQVEMENDPEAYWEKHKMNIPTPNLDALPVLTTEEAAACALCQEEIQKGQQAYRMPCCRQFYHHEAKACLGGDTIIKWLSTSRKCAGCGQEVIIPEPTEETEEKQPLKRPRD